MKVTKEEAYLTLSRYFSKQHESEYEDMVEILYQPTPINEEALDMFEKLGYTEYSDSEHYDFYTNTKKGLTIEIRKYIDEFVKYDTATKKT